MSHTWTDAARRELDQLFEQLAPHLSADGADPGEVLEDLRRSLDREIAAENLPVVTESDVRRLLAKLGATPPPPSIPPAVPPAPGPKTTDTAPTRRRRPGFFLLLFAVFLPATAIGIELATGMCAAAFFDPLPTLAHIAIAGFVPIANFLCWRAARKSPAPIPRWLLWSNSVAAGVCIFYAIQFLFLLFPGIFALIFFGLGLLPWSPILSLAATIGIRRHLRRQAAELHRPALPALSHHETLLRACDSFLPTEKRFFIQHWAETARQTTLQPQQD